MHYCHTQKGHLDSILFGTFFAVLVGALLAHAEPAVFYTLMLSATAVFVVALSFGSMTVEDEGDQLLVRYGPLPLFRKRVPYAAMTRAARSRSSWIDGWGIHYVPMRGWTYNLWGFDCVELTVDGKTLRIGTDDPDSLLAFLKGKIADNHTARA